MGCIDLFFMHVHVFLICGVDWLFVHINLKNSCLVFYRNTLSRISGNFWGDERDRLDFIRGMRLPPEWTTEISSLRFLCGKVIFGMETMRLGYVNVPIICNVNGKIRTIVSGNTYRFSFLIVNIIGFYSLHMFRIIRFLFSGLHGKLCLPRWECVSDSSPCRSCAFGCNFLIV